MGQLGRGRGGGGERGHKSKKGEMSSRREVWGVEGV